MADPCPARPDDGGDTDHCCHDAVLDGERVSVCCWCGDVFVSEHEDREHGEYEPTAPPPKSTVYVATRKETAS